MSMPLARRIEVLERWAHVLARYEDDGWSLRHIGEEIGCSRERVRQLLCAAWMARDGTAPPVPRGRVTRDVGA